MWDPCRVYDRLAARCSTPNQLNQVHILMETRMTTTEARAVAAHVVRTRTPHGVMRGVRRLQESYDRIVTQPRLQGRPRNTPRHLLDARSRDWAFTLTDQMSHVADAPGPGAHQAWRRHGATLFQSGASPSPVLVVGFTGYVQRMMMGTHVFLQYTDHVRADVLKLDVQRGSGFYAGMRGIADTFDELVEWIAATARERRAERIIAIGTSGGGLPALLAARRQGWDAVLSVGPVLSSASSYASDSSTVEEVLAAHAGANGAEPRITLAYGADAEKDGRSVDRLSQALPESRVMAVPDADHACLFPLVERGQFLSVLAESGLAH